MATWTTGSKSATISSSKVGVSGGISPPQTLILSFRVVSGAAGETKLPAHWSMTVPLRPDVARGADPRTLSLQVPGGLLCDEKEDPKDPAKLSHHESRYTPYLSVVVDFVVALRQEYGYLAVELQPQPRPRTTSHSCQDKLRERCGALLSSIIAKLERVVSEKPAVFFFYSYFGTHMAPRQVYVWSLVFGGVS
ncbi:hypothetical protein LZ30DRAFT_689422 [Colletotrichum cereale]|nr:hypothetical protein LZ30DRAFT_689422 [Colletotrichum cereale]